MADETNLGGANLSGISDSQIQTGDISTRITAGGDVVGRDKITHHYETIIQQALSAVEEATRTEATARQRLAAGVKRYAEKIRDIALDDSDTDRGGPYRGLLAYTLTEAKLFFGRDRATADLLAAIQRGRLTILHAESGAGKSSLLQAGLAYQLIAQGHLPVYVRPYNQPPALAIKRVFLPNLSLRPHPEAATSLATTPLRDFLQQVTTALGPHAVPVICLDQFEEVFTLLDEADRSTFVAELADCLEDPSLRVRWVLAMRTEFFGDLANFRPRLKNPFENDFRLNRLTLAEAEAVITQPAARHGISVAPELVQTLLADLRDPDSGQVAPPQIQLVCSALYNLLPERRQANPGQPPALTLAMYQAEGRAEGILRGHLNRVLRRTLTPEQRAAARQLLIALVSSDQRRLRRTKSELTAVVATYLTAARSLESLLDQLVESRLLTVDEDEQRDEAVYELAHDYLLTEIEIDPETQARKAAAELLAQEVESFKRYGSLLSADKFDIINSQRAFLQVDGEAAELLRLSQAARRRAQMQRVGLAALIVLLIVGAALAIAWVQSRAAATQTQLADEAAQQARLASQAESTAEAEAVRAIAAESTAQAEKVLAEASEAEAKRQAAIAQARALASQAVNALAADEVEVGLLLALEASRVAAPGEVWAALRAGLAHPWHTGPVLLGHTAAVNEARWNPERSRALTYGNDGTVRLWDLTGQQPPLVIAAHPDFIYGALWNGDGRRILSYADQGEVFAWDAATGQKLHTFEGLAGPVTWTGWSHDERYLLAYDPDTLLVWDADSGQPTLTVEMEPLEDAVWSRNSARILASSRDGTIRVWAADSGDLLLELEGHTNSVEQARWNRTETRILSRSQDGTAKVWEAASGELLLDLVGHREWVTQAFWNDDETEIFTAGLDGAVRRWAAQTGNLLLAIDTPEEIWTARLNADGTQLLTAGLSNSAYVWDVAGGDRSATLTSPAQISHALWSADGTQILTAGDDGALRLWEAASGRLLETMRGHTAGLSSLAWDSAGGQILSGSDDGSARRWHTSPGPPELPPLAGHAAPVTALTWPGPGQLVTSSEDGTVRQWELATGAAEILATHPAGMESIHWNRERSHFLTAGSDGLIQMWAAVTGQPVLTMAGHSEWVWQAVWNQAETQILSYGSDGTVRVWDAETGAEQVVIEAAEVNVRAAHWNRAGSQILTAGDSAPKVWDAETGELLLALTGHNHQVIAAAWDPAEERILSASTDHTAKVWAADSGKLLLDLTDHRGRLTGAAWNRAGSQILTSAQDNTARLWDADSGDLLLILEGHTASVEQARWSPDESRIVTASRDGTARLWDADSGDLLMVLGGGPAGIEQVGWSLDGARLITADEAGGLSQYLAELDDLQAVACRRAGRNLSWSEWRSYRGDTPYRRTCPNWGIHPEVVDEHYRQAEDLVMAGEFEAATERLAALLEIDPALTLAPAAEIERLRQTIAAELLEIGTDWAREGLVAEAAAQFEQAQRLKPDLDFDPTAEAERLAAPTFDNALDAAIDAARRDFSGVAREKFSDALDFAGRLNSAAIWHRLCLAGGQWQQAAVVEPACDRAIDLEPENGRYYNSRGIVRLQLGQLPEAQADFEVFERWLANR